MRDLRDGRLVAVKVQDSTSLRSPIASLSPCLPCTFACSALNGVTRCASNWHIQECCARSVRACMPLQIEKQVDREASAM